MGQVARQKFVVRLLNDHKVTTQNQLLQLLQENGFEVTQSTVSRDIKALNIVKVSDEAGGTYYTQMAFDQQKKMRRLCEGIRDNVSKIQKIQFMNVIRTPLNSNYANALTALLDDLNLPEVSGTIAGNDTIVIISKNDKDAE
ncbi:arginine repressor, partial [Liquorilactobacillus satsumensis]